MRRLAFAGVVLLACDRGTAATEKTEAAAKREGAGAGDTKAAEVGPRGVTVPDGPVTSKTLVAFLPERMAGAPAEMREAIDEALAAAAYRTPNGYVNVNLALARDLAFERAQVEGANEDAPARDAATGVTKQGIAVGSQRGLLLIYGGGSKSELRMFVGDRISVIVTTERTETPAAMVALAQELDLAGLASLAGRVAAP